MDWHESAMDLHVFPIPIPPPHLSPPDPRCTEQTFGLCGRRRGWDVLREPLFFRFISHIDHYTLLRRVPYVIQLLFSCPVLSSYSWPVDCSMLGLPVRHHLPEFAQVHVHCIGDAIQPCHPLMPSSPLSFNLPASGTFPMRWFTSDDQNTGVSVSASSLPMSIQGWFPSRLTGLLSLLSKGLSGVLLQDHSWEASILWHSAFFMVQLSQMDMTTVNTIALTMWTFVSRVTSLLFNTLCRFVLDFLPRSNCLLISWLQSPSAVTLEPKKRKSVTTSTFSLFICLDAMGQ